MIEFPFLEMTHTSRPHTVLNHDNGHENYLTRNNHGQPFRANGSGGHHGGGYSYGHSGNFRLHSGGINGLRFLGIFTATHLSLCLVIAGFGLLVIGMLLVASSRLFGAGGGGDSDAASSSFYSVGIALIVFAVILMLMAIGIFIAAVRWGKRKVYTLRPPTGAEQRPQIISRTFVEQAPQGFVPNRRMSMPGSLEELPPHMSWQYDMPHQQAPYNIAPQFYPPQALPTAPTASELENGSKPYQPITTQQAPQKF